MYKIIIAEDDTIIRENIAAYLEMSGYRCMAYPNGKEALHAIHAAIPDLIICDIMMPVMDGHELFNELKRNKLTSLIPFIFLTAKTDKSEITKALQLGAEYFTKPFAAKELLTVVQKKLQLQ